jgi:hypothetical protein
MLVGTEGPGAGERAEATATDLRGGDRVRSIRQPLEARLGERVGDYQRVDCGKCGAEVARVQEPDEHWERAVVAPGYYWDRHADCWLTVASARERSRRWYPARHRQANLHAGDGVGEQVLIVLALPTRIACRVCGCRQWLRPEPLIIPVGSPRFS